MKSSVHSFLIWGSQVQILSGSRTWLTDVLAKAEPITITEAVTACRDPADERFWNSPSMVTHLSSFPEMQICSRSIPFAPFPLSPRLSS